MKEYVYHENKLHEVEGENRTPAVLESIPAPLDQCSGAACGDIRIQQPASGGGTTLTNTSVRRVRITVRFSEGFGCGAPQSFILGRAESKSFGDWGYCPPIGAEYAP